MKSPETNSDSPEDGAQKGGTGKGTAGWAFLVGVVVFAVTQNPVWLAIGIAIGAATGTAITKTRQSRRDDRTNS